VLINDECDRRFILEAIEFVDYVVPFDEDTPQSLIEQIKPDFLVKGGDYKESEIVGSSFVKSYGGEVVVLPFIGDYSTTKIRNRFKNE
jgi:rfaE bifunctional protein nucleotidyltransferase chain/domain